MRVTLSSIACPAGDASSSDRSRPAGEPFRTAPGAAGTAGQPGALPGALSDPPPGDDLVEHGDHSDDTMVPATTQVAYLARLTSLPGDSTSRVASAADLDRRPRRATPADNLERAAAALALGSLAAPPPNAAPAGAPIAAPIAAISKLGAVALRAVPARTPHPGVVGAALRTGAAELGAIHQAPGFGASPAGAAASASAQRTASDAVAAPAIAAAGAPTVASAPAGSATALTPLEQAVHDLVSRLDAIDPSRGRAT